MAVSGDGFGLVGLRERAERLGGSVDVESAPGHGTTLRVAVPG
jgi:signal transduction histidine kinase